MAKVEITLDASKLRNLIQNREYTSKTGEVVKVQEIKFELIEVKEPKTVVSGAWGEKKKTHFCSVIQTKEQKAAKEKTEYIGDGFTTYFAENKQNLSTPEPDDLPFK